MKAQQGRKHLRAKKRAQKDAGPSTSTAISSRPLSTCGILLLGVLLLAFIVSTCQVLAANATVEGPFVEDSPHFTEEDARPSRGAYSRSRGLETHLERSSHMGDSGHRIGHVPLLERKRVQAEAKEERETDDAQMLQKRSRTGKGTYVSYGSEGRRLCHCHIASHHSTSPFLPSQFEPGMGACGQHSSSSDMITAISKSIWDGGAHCGKSAKVCKASDKSHCVTVKIVDECPSCSAGSLDLSPAAFKGLADLSVGEVKITWSYA